MRPARLRSEVTTDCYTEPLVHLRVGADEAGTYHPDYAVKDTYENKANSVQIQLNLPVITELGKNYFKKRVREIRMYHAS